MKSAPFVWPSGIDLPGYKPTIKPHARQIKQAAKMIAAAKRPVLYIGGGVVKARAAKELAELVEATGIPVVTTLMARGAFPDSHELNMGMPGMHGTVAAVGALQQADLLIAVGTRFDDRVTGKLDSFAPLAKVIHCDVDPAEISKNRVADLPVVGDAKAFLRGLVGEMSGSDAEKVDCKAWAKRLTGMKAKYPLGWEESNDGKLSPQYVIKRIGELSGRTRSSPRAWASTRCGRRTSCRTRSRASGSTPAAPGRWVTASPRPWVPRRRSRMRWSGGSTATAASR